MKKKNIIVVVTAAALSAAMLTGCVSIKDRMAGNYLNSKKNINYAIETMEDRFYTDFEYLEDREFEVGSGDVFGRHSGVATYIYVECDELPGEKIFVTSTDDGRVSSDYIFKLYEKEIKDVFKTLAGEVYDGELEVFLDEDRVTWNFDADTSLKDVLKSKDMHFVDICTTDDGQREEKFRRFVDLLIENQVNCIPTVTIFDEDVYSHGESYIDIFSFDNPHGIGVSRYESLSYTLDEDFEFVYEFNDSFFNSDVQRVTTFTGFDLSVSDTENND
ncbi:MAG: hypothetical protein K6C68_07730 [Ruminococcus sp.]|nr:hypothetical protein [Ruminococcus sp.]